MSLISMSRLVSTPLPRSASAIAAAPSARMLLPRRLRVVSTPLRSSPPLIRAAPSSPILSAASRHFVFILETAFATSGVARSLKRLLHRLRATAEARSDSASRLAIFRNRSSLISARQEGSTSSSASACMARRPWVVVVCFFLLAGGAAAGGGCLPPPSGPGRARVHVTNECESPEYYLGAVHAAFLFLQDRICSHKNTTPDPHHT
mmetsp:Transcript_31580/g.92799  ORF Transcript_31580/g.92799 Transcript_31580/m.92799 type:complete len:206 (-) Transcript_31580:1090-1707(-)